jgi:hypothetical protein
MRMIPTTVYREIGMEMRSPMLDLIGGVTAEIATDIRTAETPLTDVELRIRIFSLVGDALITALKENRPLIGYILQTATEEMLILENAYEGYFDGEIPVHEAYDDLGPTFERVMGHAMQSILWGVGGELSEAGLRRGL